MGAIAKFRASTTLVGAVALVVVAVMILGIVFLRSRKEKPAVPPTYVGEKRCAQCHVEQAKAWLSSHHAQAMQVANNSTVLGDFNNTRFAKDGLTSEFFSRDGKYYVRTNDTASGQMEYELPYTFGAYPLQQYLVSFPKGRLQSFPVAWDSRQKVDVGYRWFDVHADKRIPPADALHWARRNQTWNSVCADCHSTNIRKNYNLETDSYATTWSVVNVSCEACHGPGSNHVTWAEAHKKGSDASEGPDGLVVDLRPAKGKWSTWEPWKLETLHWQGEPRSHNEINTCAPCHSRRQTITSEYHPGQPFLDAFVPGLLDEDAYYPDGQILGQDYEWGSFVQSKMYEKGVTCSDCHNPHSGKLPQGSTNAVCGKCHPLANFGSAEHHHHKTESAGALCVSCHMPAQTSMVVAVNHDHSFRVPRPDFSVAYGTPNACNQCHKDKPTSWAAETVANWYGPSRRQELQFVKAIDTGRRGLPRAEQALTAVITDSGMPAIVRATALKLLPQYLSPFSFPTLEPSLGDGDALVRREAVRALAPLIQRDQIRLAAPLLTDSSRSVRIEAARLLAGTPPDLLQYDAQRSALTAAISELIASEMASAERPESHMDLALLYSRMGRASEAETELKAALHLDPDYVAAMVKLADLYSSQNRDDEAQRLLEKATAVAPTAAGPAYALALLQIKRKQFGEVLPLLGKAATLEPDNLLYSYVYAVALNSSGHTDQAITVLQQAHQRRPADRQMLIGLIAFERDRANLPAAITYARQLLALAPDDPGTQATLSELIVANDPKAYQYWVIQGDAESKMGHQPSARTAFQKGMDLATAELAGSSQPGYTHAFVAYFAARLGERSRAEQELEQALQLWRGDERTIYRAMLTYEALGERDHSIEVLSRATPQFLYELNRQPDLPALRDDPRFQDLLSKSQTKDKARR
jgi:tetratricopeptide (TPR) repeat protein